MDKYELACRNLHNPMVILKWLKDGRRRWDRIRIMAIWGLFPGEQVAFHLGHLHILQKMKDFLAAGLDAYIVINDHIEPLRPESAEMLELQQRASYMARYFNSVFSEEILVAKPPLVCVASRECQRLGGTQFEQLKRAFEDARQRLWSAFRPVGNLAATLATQESSRDADEGARLRVEIESLSRAIREEFGVDAEDFKDLYKTFVARDKYSSDTEWGPRFATFLCRVKPRPDFLFVSNRHAYIWTFYRTLFKLADQSGFPTVLLARDFMDVRGAEVMDLSHEDHAISVHSSVHEIQTKFAKTKVNPYDSALSNSVDYLIVPRQDCIALDGQEVTTFTALVEHLRQQDTAVQAAVCQNLYPILRAHVKLVKRAADEETAGEHKKITNSVLFKYMARLTDQSRMVQIIDLDGLDREAEKYLNEYSTLVDCVSEKFVQFLEQPSLWDRNVVEALGDLRNLIRSTKGMDLTLYLTDKRYRDHFLHQFNVGALGWFLLNCRVGPDRWLWEVIAEYDGLDELLSSRPSGSRQSDELRRRLVGIAWWSAALLHDHAYPLSNVFSVLPKLKELEDGNSVPLLLESMRAAYKGAASQILSSELQESVLYPLNQGKTTQATRALEAAARKYLGTVIQGHGVLERVQEHHLLDHGIIGAINIASTVRTRRLGSAAPLFDCIIKAIAFHQLADWPVDFCESPLTFLLVLCDDIQEWGRRLLLDSVSYCPIDYVNIGPFLPSPEGDRLTTLGRSLEIDFVCKEQSDEARKQLHWSYDIFVEGKNRTLGRLSFPEPDARLFPSSLRFSVTIPSGQLGSHR